MKIAVIGAGASGMMAAVSASDAGADVTLFEYNDRAGKKLLLTGSGKCNLTHLGIDGSEYHGSVGKISPHMFERFGTKETVSFFSDAGLLMYDRDGYIYPYSFQSFSVYDILYRRMKNNGIDILTGKKVKGVSKERHGSKFTILFSQTDKKNDSASCEHNGDAYSGFDRVIIACGGKSSPRTGSDGSGYDIAKHLGHHISMVSPALCGLECSDKDLRSAAKIRQRGTATLTIDGVVKASDTGEIQFTDYGLSGIPIFNISRFVGPALIQSRSRIICSIDTVPMMETGELISFFRSKAVNMSIHDADALLEGTVCASIADIVRKRSLTQRRSDGAKGISVNEISVIAHTMKALTYHVTGTRPFSDAQTSSGGIGSDEITDDLESKICPGIYFTGEMLDIDGPCGGYNLQWAWTSGRIAGCAAAGAPIM